MPAVVRRLMQSASPEPLGSLSLVNRNLYQSANLVNSGNHLK